ncbi:hypothetical protein RVR_5789 [Actinacidiphila reveromycinica]|uniref:Uncharacterized protein n=1 Tax=Actinacidiphila reveromycinica TaxID=659352 RepID=A0A7U3UV14_9ACTN|nr:hypothetical protein [Streptomyces sp. SN-593]BBA99250.1 hypothetical protein RVR_5789 [Streptomyces sp. SN-593]
MTGNELFFFLAGISIGIELALLVYFGGRHLDARRELRQARAEHEAGGTDARVLTAPGDGLPDGNADRILAYPLPGGRAYIAPDRKEHP